MSQLLAAEQVKARKLKIIFGPWWRHYAVPYEFPVTLYVERPDCPYCGGLLGPLSTIRQSPSEQQSAHLDHMDPLSRGGEDSIRNAVYSCCDCNLAKGRQLFADWLRKLAPGLCGQARRIYEDRHGHAVEAFVPGHKQARLTVPRLELSFDERVLLKL